MRINLQDLRRDFTEARRGRESPHTVAARTKPSRFQYDYLVLHSLANDIRCLIGEIGAPPQGSLALDLGSHRSPYRSLVEGRGFNVRTLDLSPDSGADFVGTAERTGLPDASFDLVICTQVLEHTSQPWEAVREIGRILRPGGHAVISVPHVWFFHPHPQDNWRFTQEGLTRLCLHGGLEPQVLLAQGGSVLGAAQVINFLIYGAIGRLGAPVFALLNSLAPWGDKLMPNALFCQNFACLARRR
jgi:SAM-dependent methyltransferase